MNSVEFHSQNSGIIRFEDVRVSVGLEQYKIPRHFLSPRRKRLGFFPNCAAFPPKKETNCANTTAKVQPIIGRQAPNSTQAISSSKPAVSIDLKNFLHFSVPHKCRVLRVSLELNYWLRFFFCLAPWFLSKESRMHLAFFNNLHGQK